MLGVFFKAHAVVGRILFLASIDFMVAHLFKARRRVSWRIFFQ